MPFKTEYAMFALVAMDESDVMVNRPIDAILKGK